MIMPLRKLLNLVGWLVVSLAALVLAFSAWIILPFRPGLAEVLTTAETLLRAPFAATTVIGDSRIELAAEPDGALFAGYPSATSRDLERLSGVVCAISSARVTIALGINDTKPDELDLAATRGAFDRIADQCARPDLRFAEVWPAEPDVEPAGANYDIQAVAEITAHLRELAAQGRVQLIAAPDLPSGFTHDGVHFVRGVSRDYARMLAFGSATRAD